MVVSSCKFPSILVFKSHPIVIRMGDTTFRATWDDKVGVVKLTKAELTEYTTSAGSDKGELITLIKHRSHCIVCTVRSRTRNTNGNGRLNVQIETEV